MKLVDSSSWSHALRVVGDAAVRDRLRNLVEAGEARWCPVIRLGLWNGARGAREKAALRTMEREILQLPINEQTWNDACILARRARDAGMTIPTNDLLIVACARQHDLEIEHCDQHIGALLGLA